MAADLYNLIPGLKEVESAYKVQQLEAFTGLEPAICGVILVNPFTPQMFVELDGCGNAFFGDELPGVADVAAFLWRISPVYKRGDNEARLIFFGLINNLPYEQCAVELYQYLKRSWAGMPQGKSTARGQQSAGTWISRIVHILASKYGWSEEEILNKPFRRLWQYINRIIEEADEHYIERCPEAQRLRAEWLTEKNRMLEGKN